MKTKGTSGQSLFEVVFAVGMSALIITAVVILAANALSNSTFSKNKALAGRFTQEAVEWLRSQRDENWDDFYNRSLTTVWCLPGVDWSLAKVGTCDTTDTIVSNSNFQREINFTGVGIGTVETKVAVYWRDGHGLHEVSTITNFTDWRRQ